MRPLGWLSLAKMEIISRTRRDACRYYNERLRHIPGIRTPKSDFSEVTPFLYYLRVPETARDDFRAALADRGIDTGIHWQPGHWFTLLKDCRHGDLSVTDRVGREIVSLPLHSKMEQASLDAVCAAVAAFFQPMARCA